MLRNFERAFAGARCVGVAKERLNDAAGRVPTSVRTLIECVCSSWSFEMNGFDWWASQRPREDAVSQPAITASPEPPESIGSVPFMRASRKLTSPGKTATVSAEPSSG
jgi:hypothetical protein